MNIYCRDFQSLTNTRILRTIESSGKNETWAISTAFTHTRRCIFAYTLRFAHERHTNMRHALRRTLICIN